MLVQELFETIEGKAPLIIRWLIHFWNSHFEDFKIQEPSVNGKSHWFSAERFRPSTLEVEVFNQTPSKGGFTF